MESSLEDAWGGQEVKAQASLASRDPAATSSPGSLGLVSSGLGREGPWESLGSSGGLRHHSDHSGKYSGEEKQPPKEKLPGQGRPCLGGRGLDSMGEC